MALGIKWVMIRLMNSFLCVLCDLNSNLANN